MTNTAKIRATLMEDSQKGAYAVFNDGILRADVFGNVTKLKGFEQNTPPSTGMLLGDTYLIGATPTGSWTGHGGQIAFWSNGWEYISTLFDMVARRDDTGDLVAYSAATMSWSTLNTSGTFPWVNVDAAYDGTDEGTALDTAITAAEAAAAAYGGAEIILRGILSVASGRSITTDNISIRGIAPGGCGLRWTSGVKTEPIITFNNVENPGLYDVSFDGRRTSGTTGQQPNVMFQDCLRTKVYNLLSYASDGEGIVTNTSSTAGQSEQIESFFVGVHTMTCAKSGQHYQGDKNGVFAALRSDNDCADSTDGDGGIVFEGMEFSADDLREITHNTINGIHITDSGRFGLILDGSTKFDITGVQIAHCQDSPWFIRNSNSSGSTNSGPTNIHTWTGVVMRNNAQTWGWSGIETDLNNTYTNAIVISGWNVVGNNTAGASPGVFDVRGWQHVSFMGVTVRSCPGVVWHVQDGENTDGSTVEPEDIKWIGCTAEGNGNALAARNDGILIESGYDYKIIGNTLANLLTSGTGGTPSNEIFIEASGTGDVVRRVIIDDNHIDAATSGSEIWVGSDEFTEVQMGKNIWRSSMSVVPTFPASVLSAGWPFEAANGMLEATGTGNVNNIKLAAPGTTLGLWFTNAAPGDLLSTLGGGSGTGNVDFAGGNVSPAQNQIVTVMATQSGWSLVSSGV